jgi:hypothetical protein
MGARFAGNGVAIRIAVASFSHDYLLIAMMVERDRRTIDELIETPQVQG